MTGYVAERLRVAEKLPMALTVLAVIAAVTMAQGPNSTNVACEDELDNCVNYGTESCKAPFIQWAIYNCRKTCNFCSACTTNGCADAANSMAKRMNTKIDPCQDFQQYVCGNDDTDFMGVMDDNINEFIEDILTKPIEANDLGVMTKMKTYLSTCLDTDKREEIGTKFYLADPYSKKWPTTNPSWNASTFDLNDVIADYESVFVQSLFAFFVKEDMNDANKYMIQMIQGEPSVDKDLYIDIAVALGADKTAAQKDVSDADVLTEEFVKIMGPDDESDVSTMNNPSTLQKMAQDYPVIDWHRAIQAAFSTVDITIPKDQPVNIQSPKYFEGLAGVLKNANPRVIQNIYGFGYAKRVLATDPRDALESIPDYRKTRGVRKRLRSPYVKKRQTDPDEGDDDGDDDEEDDTRLCLESVSSIFWEALGKQFVDHKFTDAAKQYVETMVNELKSTFRDMIGEADWMANTTKAQAYLKLDHLVQNVGYSNKSFTDADIERKYENYTVLDGQYDETNRLIFLQQNMNAIRRLVEPVDKTAFRRPPMEVNAYYDPALNQIGFSAGILQPPYFSLKDPRFVNYARIGSTIGHEITHGFDQYGSQFNYLGNLRNWWQSQDLEEFKKRTQCIIDQYGAYKLGPKGDLRLDSKSTIQDDAADCGGLEEAYRAYKSYASSHPKELPLPGLGLTLDQQFFVAYGQQWCGKMSDSELKEFLEDSDEASTPNSLRLKGPLQNSEDFAKAFQCPSGSPMNPVKKCEVW